MKLRLSLLTLRSDDLRACDDPLPFDGQRECRVQSLEAMMELQPGEKEEFLTEIYKALASISTLREKARTSCSRAACSMLSSEWA